MSMRDYGVNDFGIVIDDGTLLSIAKRKGLEYDEDDIDSYEIADSVGLEYISEFTGEATRVYPTGEFDWKTSLIFSSDVVYYLPLKNASTLFKAAYNNIYEIVDEVKERIGEFLPDDFDYAGNVRNIVGTYFG